LVTLILTLLLLLPKRWSEKAVDFGEELAEMFWDATDEEDGAAGVGGHRVDGFDGGDGGFAALAGPVEDDAGADVGEGLDLARIRGPVEDFGGEPDGIAHVSCAG